MKLDVDQCNTVISWHEIYNMMNVRNCPDVCDPQGLHSSILDYSIAEVPRDSTTQWFFDLIHLGLFSSYPNNSVNKGEFFYLHKWEKGNRFKKHIDKRRNKNWKLVCGATLNSGYEGGKLLAYSPDQEYGTEPGDIYIMEAERLHEVTEIISGTRFSFVYFLSADILGQSKTII